MARNQDAYRRFRTGAELSTAVEELLRFDSPLQMFERWVLEDTQIDGVVLRRGTKVGLLFGAANHDETVFENPEVLDLARDPNPHISFGAGVHHCVGAPLARVELEAALGRFVARVGELDLQRVDDRIESLVFRGVQRLEVGITAA